MRAAAPPAPRCGASRRLALRRKTLRVSPALRPLGFESPARGANKNGLVVGAVSKSMVGDEGFEPPALCV